MRSGEGARSLIISELLGAAPCYCSVVRDPFALPPLRGAAQARITRAAGAQSHRLLIRGSAHEPEDEIAFPQNTTGALRAR
jgi:hypothetical protein